MGLVSISIYLRHAENVVQCAPGSRATVRFQPRTAYPNGLILLEIDHGLAIGRATSSSSIAHSGMLNLSTMVSKRLIAIRTIASIDPSPVISRLLRLTIGMAQVTS